MTTTKRLYSYENGGYHVEIYSDGTKVRVQHSEEPPIYPESIDLKITNKCNLESVCTWCHEESNDWGKHGDLDRMARILQHLPPGTELAVGGGNPMAHPDLLQFLGRMKSRGIICNLTMNQRHINQYKKDITTVLKEDLIKGLGVSKSGDKSVSWLYDLSDNIVFHVIVGINNINELMFLPKTLILGYKDKGRGREHKDANVNNNILDWMEQIHTILGNQHLSFDNLAISQLRLNKWIVPEKWDEIYMGDDATFTFYIDAVRQRFSPSSTSYESFSLMESPAQMLHYIRKRQESNNIGH